MNDEQNIPLCFNLCTQMQGFHPARYMDFNELYNGLQKEIKDGNVTSQLDPTGELELFSYTVDCQFDKHWNKYNIMARGLILAPKKKQVVATPFTKFFNWGEEQYFTPDMPFVVTEKMDGSLAILFYWNKKWNVATRGSFTSEQSQWAQNYLDNYINTDCLVVGYTYLAEIIYHENRIVISYDYEGLVLLSAFKGDGKEICFEELETYKDYGFKIPKVYSYDNVEAIAKVAENLPYGQEGFVVRFNNGYRVKIKGIEYIRVHRIISNVRPLFIWESMMHGDDLDSVRKQLPEELRTDFDNIRSLIDEKFEKVIIEIKEAHEQTKHMSDKELGLALKNGELGQSVILRTMLFLVRKKDLLVEAYKGGTNMRKSVYKLFRPTNDKLPGYVPTTSMNRYAEDEG